MIGRPSVMTEALLAKLKECFLMGFTDEEACAAVGIARSTLSEYKKLNPDFSDNVHAWKSNPIIKAKFTLYKALDDPKIAMWYLERKCPEEFSLRYIIQHTQNQFTQNNIVIEYVVPSVNNNPLQSDYEELARQAGEELKKLEISRDLVD